MKNPITLAGRLLAGVLVLAGLLWALPGNADAPRPARGPMGEREITITNHSPHPINEIYISATAADTWGEDRLNEATLEPGATLRLRLGRTRDCSFDIQIIYDDATREDRTGVDVCRTRTLAVDGSAAHPLPGATGAAHLVTLLNRSPQPIRQVFISPVYAEQWGDDMLSRQLDDGDRVQIPYRGDCAADLRVVFANRSAEERRGIDICATSSLSIEPGWTTADPLPTAGTMSARHSELEVVNRSGREVADLFLYPDGTDEPSRGLLHAIGLADGATARLPFPAPGACRFRGRVVYAGAPARLLDGLDLCGSEALTLQP